MPSSEIKPIWNERLALCIKKMELSIPADRQLLLLEYIALLKRWNQVFNLTAVRKTSEMIPRHLLDSLSISRHLYGSLVLDAGTGAGLPGIPLAIVNPNRRFVLLDSSGKKTRFVLQVRMELDLENVQVVRCRIEDYRPAFAFDTITARALGPLGKITPLFLPLLAPEGRILAMKASLNEEEMTGLEFTGLDAEVRRLHVPMVAGERHLVTLMNPRDALNSSHGDTKVAKG